MKRVDVIAPSPEADGSLAEPTKSPGAKAGPHPLAALRNVGKAALADFAALGVETVAQLAAQDADELYLRLSRLKRVRQDPCVHDVFAAAIHESKTGEARVWWAFTPARKARQAAGDFPCFDGNGGAGFVSGF